MKNLKMALCFLDEEDNIIVKRLLNVHWELNIEQDLKMFHNIHMKDEIATIITQQTKMDLDKGTVKDMLDEIGELEDK